MLTGKWLSVIREHLARHLLPAPRHDFGDFTVTQSGGFELPDFGLHFDCVRCHIVDLGYDRNITDVNGRMKI